MPRQKPKYTVDQIMAIHEKERRETGYRSNLGTGVRVRLHRVMPDESLPEARIRWRREQVLELELAAENRRDGTGRVEPVRYDDDEVLS